MLFQHCMLNVRAYKEAFVFCMTFGQLQVASEIAKNAKILKMHLWKIAIFRFFKRVIVRFHGSVSFSFEDCLSPLQQGSLPRITRTW